MPEEPQESRRPERTEAARSDGGSADESGEQADPERPMEEEVGAKEQRKLKARREKDRSIWFGLGMFGMIGWSVAVPTLVGVAIGVWIDSTWPGPISWTLTLLFAGVVIGCLNAWNWVKRESEG